MNCPKCGSANPEGARFCQQCGTALAAPAGAPAGRPAARDDWVSRQIPYKNPKALTAYYIGVFGMIPCLGAPLAVAAKKNPDLHGKSHAWTGIVLGALSLLYQTVGMVLLFRLGP